MGKAEVTSEFIIKTVAPYFNKHGYFATSMSDITHITGLTKGAIYGNFENKEELAYEAFRYNIRRTIGKIDEVIRRKEKSYDKLCAIINYYRNYPVLIKETGGCPVLNVGVDSQNNDPKLQKKVQTVVKRIKKTMQDIIQKGIDNCEISESANPERLSNVFYNLIEGGIFTAGIMKDEKILMDSLDHLEELVVNIRI